MNLKKTTISTAIILSLLGTTQANQFQIIVSQDRNKYDVIESQEPVPTDWENVGSPYSCFARFDTDDYNLGTIFTQIEDCKQKQERTVVIKEVFNGEERYRSITEERIIDIETSYTETGTKNYKTGIQKTEYTEWTNTGTHYNCDAFAPLPSEIYTGTTYTQNRNCSQNQDRVENIYDIWADGSETTYTSTPESQTIIEIESNQSVGTFLAQSCKQILNSQGNNGSGTYSIYINSAVKTVNCDMITDGGGWTIFGTNTTYNLLNVNDGLYNIEILSLEDLINMEHIKNISTENALDSDWVVTIQADDSVNPSSITYKSLDLINETKVEMMNGWNNTQISLNFNDDYPRVYCYGANGTNNCGLLNKPDYLQYSPYSYITSIKIDPRGEGSRAHENGWHRNKSTVSGTRLFYMFR